VSIGPAAEAFEQLDSIVRPLRQLLKGHSTPSPVGQQEREAMAEKLWVVHSLLSHACSHQFQLADFYTVEECAAALDVGPRRVRQMIDEGKVEAVALSGRYLVVRASVFGNFQPTGHTKNDTSAHELR
jgi:excisionase family DNA binding protein